MVNFGKKSQYLNAVPSYMTIFQKLQVLGGKFLQYGIRDAIPYILRYYKPMFGGKIFFMKITQNSRIRDFRENREFFFFCIT